MYKKILIPMALSHGIASTAIAAAQQLLSEGGEMVALHVYEAPEGSVSAYLDGDIVRAAYDRAEQALNERVSGIDRISPVMKKGHIARTIIDYAAEIDADCIVIGSHKPELSDYLLGTTASRVVRHAHCAVHVVRLKD